MEISAFTIWLITTLSNLREVFLTVGGITLGFGSIILVVVSLIESGMLVDGSSTERTSRELLKWKNFLKKIICITVMMILVSCFIPTKREFVAMYIIPPVANNKDIQKLPENVASFVNDYIEHYRKEVE